MDYRQELRYQLVNSGLIERLRAMGKTVEVDADGWLEKVDSKNKVIHYPGDSRCWGDVFISPRCFGPNGDDIRYFPFDYIIQLIVNPVPIRVAPRR